MKQKPTAAKGGQRSGDVGFRVNTGRKSAQLGTSVHCIKNGLYVSSSNSIFASWRSGVSNPSVNQAYRGARRSQATAILF